MFSEFIYVVACYQNSFLKLSTIHCMVYHSLLIHLSVDRYFGYFYQLTFVNDTAVNVGVQVSAWVLLLVIFYIYLEVELLGHVVWSLGWEDPLEKEMATHSSTHGKSHGQRSLVGRLQSTGSQRVRDDWATSLYSNAVFNFLRKHQTDFHSSCTILHFYQQWVGVPFFSTTLTTLVIFPFFFFFW